MIVRAIPLLFLAACKTTPVPENPPPSQITTEIVDSAPVAVVIDASAPKDDAVTIELVRGECYGVCPDYTIKISGDGTVEYEGRAFVNKHGKLVDHVPATVVSALVKKFDDARFDTLSIPDNCPRISTDHSMVTLTLGHAGRWHRVPHYLGNSCAPPVLFDLEKAVDDAVQSDRWTRCGPTPTSFCAR